MGKNAKLRAKNKDSKKSSVKVEVFSPGCYIWYFNASTKQVKSITKTLEEVTAETIQEWSDNGVLKEKLIDLVPSEIPRQYISDITLMQVLKNLREQCTFDAVKASLIKGGETGFYIANHELKRGTYLGSDKNEALMNAHKLYPEYVTLV